MSKAVGMEIAESCDNADKSNLAPAMKETVSYYSSPASNTGVRF